jgi:hypothetical protein
MASCKRLRPFVWPPLRLLEQLGYSFDVIAGIHKVVWKIALDGAVRFPRSIHGFVLNGKPKKIRLSKKTDDFILVHQYSNGDPRLLVQIVYGPRFRKDRRPYVLLNIIRDDDNPNTEFYDHLAACIARRLDGRRYLHEVEVYFDCVAATWPNLQQRFVWLKNRVRYVQMEKTTLHVGGRRSRVRIRIYSRNEKVECNSPRDRIEATFRFPGFDHSLRSLCDFLRQNIIVTELSGSFLVTWGKPPLQGLSPHIRELFNEKGLQAVYCGGIPSDFPTVADRAKVRKKLVLNEVATRLVYKLECEIHALSGRWLEKPGAATQALSV